MRIYLILTDYSGDSSWRLDIKPFVAECPHSSSSNSPPRLCLLLACKNNGRSKTMAIKFKWSIGKWPRDANTKFGCQTKFGVLNLKYINCLKHTYFDILSLKIVYHCNILWDLYLSKRSSLLQQLFSFNNLYFSTNILSCLFLKINILNTKTRTKHWKF